MSKHKVIMHNDRDKQYGASVTVNKIIEDNR
jgi:hypothetical protein